MTYAPALNCIKYSVGIDPTSGSGSLLINIGQSVSKYVCDSDNIKYYAQELKENTYNLTRMNLVMRGIKPSNIVARNGDTLENDWPYFEENDPVNSYDPLYVDAVVSNPPYSQTWDPTGKASDPRYARFGLAPKGKADYAFLLHDLYHLKPDGIMTIVLPHGVLFRGGEEVEIRKNLIENNHIDAIIGLPANIFFGTGIPTIIMVLKQNRLNSDVLIVDASKGFIKEGKNNKLRASDIKRISDVLLRRWNVPKFSRRVPRDEIRANAYNLNIPRYVDSSEEAESWDIYASMFGGIPERELARLDAYWRAFPSLKSALFKPDRPYAKLTCADIDAAVKANEDVRRFAQDYAAAMRTLQDVMHERLFDTMFDLVPSQEEAVLADAMFKRLEGMPLLDRYEAYQLLDDQWTKIATDLEVIQSEGFDAVKKVDPAMVIKRKDGQDQEVQNGWTGRVIPFSLIQASLLKADHDAIRALEEDLAEKPSAYAEILESLTEDERESLKDQLTEEADAFIPAALGKKIKELKADPSGDALALRVKLEAADAIVRDEKDLKARIKSASAKLEAKTKAAIENLTYDEAIQLLQAKWIDALLENLNKLPSRIVDGFIQELQTLAAKYETTFSAIETEIEETQTKLADMIAELSGSEFDQEGLRAFQTLLRGEAHG